jgi:hypothetical protein
MAAAGRRKEPGPAAEWFEACVGLLILGFFYQLIGTLMVRFLGFGGFLVTLGALMVVFGVTSPPSTLPRSSLPLPAAWP